jgi:hypothetical protein
MATALIAMLVATSSAGAASFSGGTAKLDFKGLKSAKQSNKGGTAAKNTFAFAENAGTATMNAQASGNLNIGSKNTAITLTRGGKSIVLQSLVQKLKSGKGVLSAKIKGKGKLIDFFDQASSNRVSANADFTQLSMASSKMKLTKAGAAALNKAFGLKGTAVYKAKAAAGTASFTANRSLTVTGGSTRTVYDQKFVNDLRACNIELGPVDPATAIPKDPASAPEGGVQLPINSQAGGTLNAQTLVGQVNHLGGTRLDRPAPGQPGNTTGKAEYHSPLSNFVFGLQGGALHTLTATIVNANNLSTNIGSVTGTPTKTLTDGPGKVALTGELLLSEAASGTLSQKAPPLGADCPIPPGSKIGSIVMDADVG